MRIGWGKNSKLWTMNDGGQVMATYRYISIWFIGFAYNTKWALQAAGQNEQVTRNDLITRYGDDTPQLSIFARFGLFIAIALITAFIMISKMV